MTKDPGSSASPSTTLPSGRMVAAGDSLNVIEAQHLVILQQGMVPLRPVAVNSGIYVLYLAGVLPTTLVLAELFTGSPPLIVDRKAAGEAYDLRIDLGGATPVPVPIGDDQYVLQDFDDMTSEALKAALDWQTTWWDQEVRVATLEIEASRTGAAQA